MDIFKNIKAHRQIKKTQKANSFNLRQFKKLMKEHFNRELDIQEILSREYSADVIVDAYEYCMRKCNWDPSTLKESRVKEFLLCNIFYGEVGNGGISQFFSNSSGDMTEETVSALDKIDKTAAKLLREALHCFPNGIAPKNREARNNLMEQFDEYNANQLDSLDRIVWEHDISQSCYEFLQAHKDDFLHF